MLLTVSHRTADGVWPDDDGTGIAAAMLFIEERTGLTWRSSVTDCVEAHHFDSFSREEGKGHYDEVH